jgi:hypothetical protein
MVAPCGVVGKDFVGAAKSLQQQAACGKIPFERISGGRLDEKYV